MHVYIYMYVKSTWNPKDLSFDSKGPCFGGLSFKLEDEQV